MMLWQAYVFLNSSLQMALPEAVVVEEGFASLKVY